MNYKEIKKRARQFESVTSLKVEEFDHLLAIFSDKWRNYYRIHTIEGKRRNAPLMKPEKPTKSLPSTAEKLFFILVYLKNYALQEMTAASFGFSQGQASKWQKALRPLLHESLKSLDVLPTREGHKVAGILDKLGEARCFQDGSERDINRPADQTVQEGFFSGKKKGHEVKNNFLATENQYVVYLSPTHEGSVHDKKMADEDLLVFPDGTHLFQDTGYQGYAPSNVFIVQPFKKPRNGELCELKKWFNKYVSKIRICVEHAINGVKRCRVVKDKCRHFRQHFRDQVIDICTGLHNFRVCSPFRSYKCNFKWAVN